MTSPSSRAASATAPTGFTLIEMLVVLVVLGLLVGLVVGRGPERSAALDLRAAAESVADGLRLARAQAISTDRTVTVVLDPAAHGFRVGAAPPPALPLGIALAAASPVRFAPDGSAAGGPIELAGGGKRLVIGVNWLTGRVTVAQALADAR